MDELEREVVRTGQWLVIISIAIDASAAADTVERHEAVVAHDLQRYAAALGERRPPL
jgi:hypothetical protein